MTTGMQRTLLTLALLPALFVLPAAYVVTADNLVCGDIDGNGAGPNVSDLSYLVSYLFEGGPEPPGINIADIDLRPGVNVADVVYLVNYLFKGGPDPRCQGGHSGIEGAWCLSEPRQGLASSVTQSECLENRRRSDSGYMWIELIGNDLHVHHMNAWYQCCLVYDVTYEVDGYDITAYEADLGELCDCYCHSNLESVLPDLMISEPCEYVVTLIGIEGDTVGVDTLVISDSTYMYVDVVGNHLHVHHMNAYANCCPEFHVEYEFDGPNITVTETDSLAVCYCMCYYNLKSIAYDVAPGEYYVTLIGVCDVWGSPCDTVGVDTVVVGDGSR